MIRREIQMMCETGLHARPASQLSSLASRFSCDTWMRVRQKQVNLKSVLDVMACGAKKGITVEIICSGPDEQLAITEIISFFKRLNNPKKSINS